MHPDQANLENLTALWRRYGARPLDEGSPPAVWTNTGWPHRCWAAPDADPNLKPERLLALLSDLSVVPVWPGHWWLLGLALGIHACGWLLIAKALPRLPALDTSVMLLLQPALTLVWAMIIFDERLSTAQRLGVLLVLVGIGTAASRGIVRPTEAGTPTGS